MPAKTRLTGIDLMWPHFPWMTDSQLFNIVCMQAIDGGREPGELMPCQCVEKLGIIGPGDEATLVAVNLA